MINSIALQMLVWIIIFLIITVSTAFLAFTQRSISRSRIPRFFFFLFATLLLATLFIEMIKM
ncbi:hypothetical protein [Roseivirga thermotolerans]|uniref:hypothetical protein n=1 Tax=Roseivirga thermotolerans TaxID=1758176 RepID=UPI00273DB220|nr:hypothetical protein [Roseivirga thermotolerans]